MSASVFSQATTGKFKLALAQMYVEPGNLEKNLSHAADLVAEATSGGADVVLLPEVMDLGWTHPSAHEFAGTIPGGEASKRLCQAAKKNNVYICAGIVERDGEKVYNAAVIINNKGKILVKHRKLNELDI
ncbi:MAG TPA: carbon-nitrogen hydrolase family protein, partial [Cyclobacteriaceae bacterium]|nr:carbon-nitrogen hydrolase family protein [Cyclobacteriaceae bacterium]